MATQRKSLANVVSAVEKLCTFLMEIPSRPAVRANKRLGGAKQNLQVAAEQGSDHDAFLHMTRIMQIMSEEQLITPPHNRMDIPEIAGVLRAIAAALNDMTSPAMAEA